MAKPDKVKVDRVAKQVAHAQSMVQKMQAKIADPNATEEDIAEAEQTLVDMNKKLERLTGTAPVS